MICALLLGSTLSEAKPLPKGILASVNKGENTVSLIRLETGETMIKLASGMNPQEVVFSEDGLKAVVSNMGKGATQPGKTLTVIDVLSRKLGGEVDLGEHHSPHGLVFLDEDRVLMTSHATDSLVVVNVEEKVIERAVKTEGKGTHLVVLSPDKKTAYTANVFTGDVSVIDLALGKTLKRIPAGQRAEGISISPDGKLVAIGCMGDNTVSIIDTVKLEVIKTIEGLAGPIRTFFSNDGLKLLVSCAGSGEVAVIDRISLRVTNRISLCSGGLFTLSQGTAPIPMNFERHADGRHIFVAVINADAIAVINLEKMAVVGKAATGSLPDGIAWTKGTS